jgi:dienelactone hydrolase
VRATELILVDRSRPTEAGTMTPRRPERTLVTTVLEPEGPGPFPLIVFSHGLSGHPDRFSRLLRSWAANGFVVAAPAFPLTNERVPGADNNWMAVANQPGDVSFVIDEILVRNATTIRPDRIGAGGLSLGGATTYAVAFDDRGRDERIRAAVVLAGALIPVGGEYDLDGHVPLLIIHGDHDEGLHHTLAANAFAEAAAPVWFVTLLGGGHGPPFEDPVTPYDDIVITTTADFWLGTLTGDPDALARVEADATIEGLSTLKRKEAVGRGRPD